MKEKNAPVAPSLVVLAPEMERRYGKGVGIMSSDRWKWWERSEHRGFSTRTQTAEKVLRWYSTHVAGLVKVAGWGRGVALVLASVALDENTGNDKQEDGA